MGIYANMLALWANVCRMMGYVVYEVNGLGYGLWGCRIYGCDVGLSNTIFVLCLYYKYNRKALHK